MKFFVACPVLLQQIALSKRDKCILNFLKIVEKLFQKKLLSSKEVDDLKLQFEEFIDNVVKCNLDKLLSFNIFSSSFNAFYGQWLNTEIQSLAVYGK